MPQNKQAFVNAIVQSLGAGQPNRRPLIAMRGIRKSYYIGQPNELEILHGIDLTVWPGEFVAIVGESGSGKSTLMNIIGVLDKPTSGEYTLDGVDIHKADDDELAGIRNNKIGFVFQTYNLIGRQSALKNVELPMLYAGIPGGERTRRAKEWLDRVGMGERARHQPNELSGGQKQRVAIARAMVNDPALILADEPTGALDSETSRVVMNLFHEMHEKYHKTIVLITHNPALAEGMPASADTARWPHYCRTEGEWCAWRSLNTFPWRLPASKATKCAACSPCWALLSALRRLSPSKPSATAYPVRSATACPAPVPAPSRYR